MFQFLHLQKNLSFTETFYLPFVTGLGVGEEIKPVALTDEKLQVQNNEGIGSKRKKERKKRKHQVTSNTGTKIRVSHLSQDE